MWHLSKIIFVFCIVSAGISTAAIAEQSPRITVAVDNESISEEDTVETRSDPKISIDINTDSTLKTVELRVDGEIRQSYKPNTKSFSKNHTLEFENGEHTVQIIASTNANGSETFSFTLIKDDVFPRVAFTSPFQTSRYAPPPESTTVNDANVTLAGDLFDSTGVSEIRIERLYYYTSLKSRKTSRTSYTINNPGDSFSQSLFLGNGENIVTIVLTDELGNFRRQKIRLVVDDTTPPAIDIALPAQTGADHVQVQGTITDNVKIDTVTVIRPDGTEARLLGPTDPEPSRNQLSATIDTRVALREGMNTISVRATDVAGNNRTRDFRVKYDPTVEPRIVFNQTATRVVNGSVQVHARVDRMSVKTVTVETSNNTSGRIIDLTQIYDGDGITQVDINESLSIANGETRVRILVVTISNEQFERSIVITPSTRTTKNRTEVTATNIPTETKDTETTKTSTKTPTTTPTTGSKANKSNQSEPKDGTPEVSNPSLFSVSINMPIQSDDIPIPLQWIGIIIAGIFVFGLGMYFFRQR